MQLQNKTILMREPRVSDASKLLESLDSVAFQFIPLPNPYTKKNALEWIKNSRKDNGEKKALHLLIVDKKTGELVGGAGIHHFEKFNRKCEMGYLIYKPFRKQGFASLACQLLLKHAFEKLKFNKVSLHIHVKNKASQALARKLGFFREARLKQAVFRQGKFHDEYFYSIFKKDWQKKD